MARLTAIWPGLVAQWRIYRLPPLDEEVTRIVVQERLNAFRAASGWIVLPGLVEGLISGAKAWSGGECADPGRSLLFLASLVKYVSGLRDRVEDPRVAVLEELQKHQAEAVAAQDFEKAAAIRDRVDKLKKKPTETERTILGPETVARFLAVEPTCR